MARFILGGFVCFAIFLSQSPSVLGQKGSGGKGGGGKGGGGKGLDWPVTWPCPMKNTTFVEGPLCRSVAKLRAPIYEICGWECNRMQQKCQFWTFNEKRKSCTFFNGKCYPVEKRNFISGKNGCPIHPYTVQDESHDATCRPCGLCPCCFGFCFWGWFCIGDGWCPLGQGPDTSTTLTVEHAQMSAALQVTEDGCSQECGADGSIEQCYNCVAGIITDLPLYCIKCLKSILMEIIVCLEKYDDPKEIIDCVLASPVPDDCTDCVCDILCHIEPSLCKLCHEESQSSDRSLMRSGSKCPPQWHYFPISNNSSGNSPVCYRMFLSETTMSQSDATTFCSEQGGCLVTIDTKPKQKFIIPLLQKTYQLAPCDVFNSPENCVWSSGFSLKKDGPWTPISTWRWNCPLGDPEPLSVTNFTNWGPGEPNNLKMETSIMFNLQYPFQPGYGIWNNSPPTSKFQFMCQREPTSS